MSARIDIRNARAITCRLHSPPISISFSVSRVLGVNCCPHRADSASVYFFMVKHIETPNLSLRIEYHSIRYLGTRRPQARVYRSKRGATSKSLAALLLPSRIAVLCPSISVTPNALGFVLAMLAPISCSRLRMCPYCLSHSLARVHTPLAAPDFPLDRPFMTPSTAKARVTEKRSLQRGSISFSQGS